MKRPKGAKYRNLYEWRGSIWAERMVGGRRYKVDTKASPETREGWSEAALFRDRYEERKGIGRRHPQPGQVPRFADLVEAYFESRKFSKLAPTTRQDRRSHLAETGAVLPTLGSMRVDDITADTLVTWWERESLARKWNLATGFRYLSSIAEVLKGGARRLHGQPLPTIEARRRIAEERNTASGRSESGPKIRPIRDPEAIARLLEAAREEGLEGQAFVTALLDTGGREGELRALRWRCIAWGVDEDDVRRHVLIERSRSRGADEDGTTKSGRSRKVGLSRRLRSALVELFQAAPPRSLDDVCFGTMDKRTIDALWARVIEKADLPGVRLKDCRDTFASHLLTAGFSIQWVSRQLGHSGIGVTEAHYARYLGAGGEDHVYAMPAALAPGEVPADVLAKLSQAEVAMAEGDPFSLPAALRPV